MVLTSLRQLEKSAQCCVSTIIDAVLCKLLKAIQEVLPELSWMGKPPKSNPSNESLNISQSPLPISSLPSVAYQWFFFQTFLVKDLNSNPAKNLFSWKRIYNKFHHWIFYYYLMQSRFWKRYTMLCT